MEGLSSLEEDLSKAQLEIAMAQNARLIQENNLLRQKLENLIAEKHSNSSVHVQAKLKAFKLEEERDCIYEKLGKIKHKYNQLHEAYLQKVKRCKALEDVFKRQKTLNGLVMKSAIDQKQKEHLVVSKEERKDVLAEKQTIESLEVLLAKLQTTLHEAYDIIDELEFELESVDFLEVENQRLRNELETYKKEKHILGRVIDSNHLLQYEQQEEKLLVDEKYDEVTVYRSSDDVLQRHEFDSNASSIADSIVGDLDPATLERSILTESLIKTVESESNCLRRELLRSRLQKANRPCVNQTSAEAKL